MNKIAWGACQIALLISLMTGCAGKQASVPPANQPPVQQETVQKGAEGTTNEAAKTPVENKKADKVAAGSMTINVYYTNSDQTKLLSSTQKINYTDALQKYKLAFQALQRSDSADQVPLWAKSIGIQQIKFEKGALTLDITLPDDARLGAEGEALALDALTKTMFQFPEVKTFNVLVDGKALDSLMGHMDLDHPIKRKH